MKDESFELAYLNILEEETKSKIDELVDENNTTIAEDPNDPENQDNQETPENNSDDSENSENDEENPEGNMDSAETNQEFEDDGWGEQIEEDLSPILEKLDDFSYEIRNCVRGSMTGAKTRDELADYINSLAEELNDYAETLRG